MASPWTEERLQVLVRDRVEENAVLEYKRCDSLQKTDGKRVEISKDVSAFANAAGGAIVYGIIEDDHAPTQLDNGLDPADISKEWLEQVINGKIQPRIDGVRIFPVPLDKSHPGKVAYVVEVPQSLTAHQAADQRYYKRFNFQSIPMEDYEIRDVMNRVKHPRLEPKISYVVDRRQERNARNRAYQLLLSLVNSGSIRAIDVKFVMEFPAQMVADVGAAFERRRLRADSRRYPTEEFSFKKPSFVVFPDDEWRPSDYDPYRFIYRVDDAIHEFISHESPVLKWKVFADDMPPRSGEVPLKELNDF